MPDLAVTVPWISPTPYAEAVNYRAAPRIEERIETLRYRPLNPVVVVLVSAFFSLMALVTLGQTERMVAAVELSCTRGGPNVCEVRRSWGPFTRRTAVPIERVQGVVVNTHRGKNNSSFSVDLVSKEGSSIELLRPTSRTTAESMRTRVLAALRDPEPGETTLPTQESAPVGGFFVGLLSLAIWSVMLLFTRTARVEVDLHRRVLRFHGQRFPFPPVRRTFRLDEVESAFLRVTYSSKGGASYEPVLILRDGEHFGTIGNSVGTQARGRRVVEELERVLGVMRAEESEARGV